MANYKPINLAFLTSFFFFTISSTVICAQTSNTETVTDIDGNVYHTVKIGNQVWTVENLRTTKYNDGTVIPHVTDSVGWTSLKTGAYCYFANKISYKEKYGALYNWYAVGTGKLAQKGWHVPTDKDWAVLMEYLMANGYTHDGSQFVNTIAKSLAAKTGWIVSMGIGTIGKETNKNNTTGFSALPGGYRGISGYFFGEKYIGIWWSAVDIGSNAFCFSIFYDNAFLSNSSNFKECGYSVRLIKE